MKTMVVLLSVASAAALVDRFSAWQTRHGKKYTSVEETRMRRGIFAANVAKVQKHNGEGHSWTMG